MPSRLLFLIFVFLLASSAAADAPFYEGNPYFEGPFALKVDEVRSYFSKIQTAVAMDDVQWLSSNIAYPFSVGHGKQRIKVSNVNEFVKDYKLVFTKTIKQAVACQTFDDLFANYNGVMIGQGAIWFSLEYLPDVEAAGMGHKPPPSSTMSTADLQKSMSDHSKWDFRIIAVNNGQPIAEFVKRCQSKGK